MCLRRCRLPEVLDAAADRRRRNGVGRSTNTAVSPAIVTVEDIAEELVGEIADEHDGTENEAVRRQDGWLLPGDMHVDEAQRVLDQRLPEGDYETLAGMLMQQLGRLPAVGDTIEIALPLDIAGSA